MPPFHRCSLVTTKKTANLVVLDGRLNQKTELVVHRDKRAIDTIVGGCFVVGNAAAAIPDLPFFVQLDWTLLFFLSILGKCRGRGPHKLTEFRRQWSRAHRPRTMWRLARENQPG